MSNTLRKRKNMLHVHTFTGYAGDIPYVYYKTNKGIVDGINRMHIDLFGKCDGCGKEVRIARMHCDNEGKLYNFKK